MRPPRQKVGLVEIVKRFEFVDAHVHLTDWSLWHTSSWKTYLEEQSHLGLCGSLMGGVEPDEWSRQIQIRDWLVSRSDIELSVGLVFGFHPWHVVSRSSGDPEAFEISQYLKILNIFFEKYDPAAIGEVGLDFGKRQDLASRPFQKQMLLAQLEFAAQRSLPVVLHCVQAHREVLEILDAFKGRLCGGLVHGFAQDWSIAQRYVELGFVVSVGTRGLENRSAGLMRTLKEIPLDWLVFETDVPGPEERASQAHQSPLVLELIQRVARSRGIRPDQLAKMQIDSLRRVFPKWGLRT